MLATLIIRVEFLRPGLFPVVHVTSDSVAAVTGQSIPSILIELSVSTVEKPLPEKVTSVPPVTVPNLGLIATSFGVKVPK